MQIANSRDLRTRIRVNYIERREIAGLVCIRCAGQSFNGCHASRDAGREMRGFCDLADI